MDQLLQLCIVLAYIRKPDLGALNERTKQHRREIDRNASERKEDRELLEKTSQDVAELKGVVSGLADQMSKYDARSEENHGLLLSIASKQTAQEAVDMVKVFKFMALSTRKPWFYIVLFIIASMVGVEWAEILATFKTLPTQ